MPPIDISNYKQRSKKVAMVTPKTSVFDILNKDISFGNGQLPDKKKEAFYNELGTLIRSGIDIKTSLELTGSSYTKAKDIELFRGIQEAVVAGQELAEFRRTCCHSYVRRS